MSRGIPGLWLRFGIASTGKIQKSVTENLSFPGWQEILNGFLNLQPGRPGVSSAGKRACPMFDQEDRRICWTQRK